MNKTETLTVGELRKLLAEYEDDTPVLMRAPLGDHWGTVAARPVIDAEETVVEWDTYHDQYVIRDQEDDDQDGEWALVIGA